MEDVNGVVSSMQSWGADVVPWIAALSSHIDLSKGSDDCRVGLERIASGLIWK